MEGQIFLMDKKQTLKVFSSVPESCSHGRFGQREDTGFAFLGTNDQMHFCRVSIQTEKKKIFCTKLFMSEAKSLIYRLVTGVEFGRGH